MAKRINVILDSKQTIRSPRLEDDEAQEHLEQIHQAQEDGGEFLKLSWLSVLGANITAAYLEDWEIGM